eukprot:gnl/Carplike_NY0171/2784_a3737_674.p1 GENE.gnl/Carplike_NY0171/2784_a3737_674~~gnl/Carplike_NY0171/2784_a3737_674.p1  ORF type:complete len:112 (+),score=0.20 gnl/Carplike_NY0171/2784_a3737_674:119-454(+)
MIMAYPFYLFGIDSNSTNEPQHLRRFFKNSLLPCITCHLLHIGTRRKWGAGGEGQTMLFFHIYFAKTCQYRFFLFLSFCSVPVISLNTSSSISRIIAAKLRSYSYPSVCPT